MIRLLLLRHAKTEDHGARPDFDRVLTDRGRRASPVIGAHMEMKGYRPDRVLCSPAVRARQTLYLAATEIMSAPEIVFVPGLYNAEPEDYVEQITLFGEHAETLLVVGHNPATQDVAGLLVNTARSAVPLPSDYPTAALAVIEFDAANWAAMRERTGRLVDFVRPRDLD